MKKIFLKVIFILSAMTITSCTQDSLDPLPVKVVGQFVKLDITQGQLDFSDFNNTAFRGTLSVPGNNVARYELFIRRRTPSGINTSDLVPYETITTFPYDLVATPTKIAAALGIQPADLQAGDIYRFVGYSYDSNGTKVGFNNLSSTLRNTDALKQGYRWSTEFSASINPEVPFNNYTPFNP